MPTHAHCDVIHHLQTARNGLRGNREDLPTLRRAPGDDPPGLRMMHPYQGDRPRAKLGEDAPNK
eukprot:9920925-Lingulodinium_polyedra.AAC.1